MSSISIQGRVDSGAWEGMKRKGETNTLLLQRLTSHYAATSSDELAAIAPTPDAAIAVLLSSHKMLNQLMQNAAIALPEKPSEPATAAPTEPTCYDDEY